MHVLATKKKKPSCRVALKERGCWWTRCRRSATSAGEPGAGGPNISASRRKEEGMNKVLNEDSFVIGGQEMTLVMAAGYLGINYYDFWARGTCHWNELPIVSRLLRIYSPAQTIPDSACPGQVYSCDKRGYTRYSAPITARNDVVPILQMLHDYKSSNMGLSSSPFTIHQRRPPIHKSRPVLSWWRGKFTACL